MKQDAGDAGDDFVDANLTSADRRSSQKLWVVLGSAAVAPASVSVVLPEMPLNAAALAALQH